MCDRRFVPEAHPVPPRRSIRTFRFASLRVAPLAASLPPALDATFSVSLRARCVRVFILPLLLRPLRRHLFPEPDRASWSLHLELQSGQCVLSALLQPLALLSPALQTPRIRRRTRSASVGGIMGIPPLRRVLRAFLPRLAHHTSTLRASLSSSSMIIGDSIPGVHIMDQFPRWIIFSAGINGVPPRMYSPNWLRCPPTQPPPAALTHAGDSWPEGSRDLFTIAAPVSMHAYSSFPASCLSPVMLLQMLPFSMAHPSRVDASLTGRCQNPAGPSLALCQRRLGWPL